MRVGISFGYGSNTLRQCLAKSLLPYLQRTPARIALNVAIESRSRYRLEPSIVYVGECQNHLPPQANSIENAIAAIA